jgi:hypothetical protein
MEKFNEKYLIKTQFLIIRADILCLSFFFLINKGLNVL